MIKEPWDMWYQHALEALHDFANAEEQQHYWAEH